MNTHIKKIADKLFSFHLRNIKVGLRVLNATVILLATDKLNHFRDVSNSAYHT
jgi:hypothetical protein